MTGRAQTVGTRTRSGSVGSDRATLVSAPHPQATPVSQDGSCSLQLARASPDAFRWGGGCQYTTAAGAVETTITYGETTALSTYHTVLQFPYDPTKGVYELDGTYGAILAMKKVRSRSLSRYTAAGECAAGASGRQGARRAEAVSNGAWRSGLERAPTSTQEAPGGGAARGAPGWLPGSRQRSGWGWLKVLAGHAVRSLS